MPAITQQQITLRGELMAFRAIGEDGWGVGTIDTGAERYDVEGKLVGVRPGSTVELEGVWNDHPKYGRRLKVRTCTVATPDSPEGIVSWLATTLPGIGMSRARTLVDHFGAGLWDVIEHRPEELLQVQGITSRRVEQIREAYTKHRAERDHMVALRGWGLTDGQIANCVAKWNTLASVVAHIRENPYQLSQHVHGFGFLRADQVATKAGVKYDSPLRIAAAVEHVLQMSCGDGHVFLPAGYLVVKTMKLLGVGEELVRDAVRSAIRSGRVIRRGPRIFTPRMDSAEHSLALSFVELLETRAA